MKNLVQSVSNLLDEQLANSIFEEVEFKQTPSVHKSAFLL